MLGGSSAGGQASANKGDIYPRSKFIRIPMRESSGASMPYITHNGESAFTFADNWLNYRAHPDGSNAVLVNDQRFDDIFNLSTLNGGLMILMSLTYSVVPSATEKIFQYGALSRVAPGGIYIDINNTASNLRCVVVPSDNTVDSSFAQRVGTSALDSLLTMCVYIDMANGVLSMGINNEWTNADADLGIVEQGDADKLVSTTDGNYGFSLFAQHNAAVDTPAALLNSGTGEMSVSDFWAVRFEYDAISDIPTYFDEYHKNPRDNLRRLDGK